MTRPVSVACIASLALAAACFVSACKKQEVRSETDSFVGKYTLISVDGELVPANVSHQGVSLVDRSGVFTINADGTCKSKTVFVPPSGSEVTREVSATYTKESATLTMQWKGAGVTTGTLEGNTFTMDNGGMIFFCKK
jgi:hypothetical protein